MRIDRLDLIAFGPFTGAALDLSGGSEGLHLIYGPNEAGKSSALRAVRQLFCGIPHQSADNFVHKHGDMRIGATLRGRAGASLELVRRKGVKNTLLGPGGAPVDDADVRLARLLGGVTPEEFLQKFVIDHAELVAGGKIVADGGGDLGRVLFAAGSGLANLGAVQKSLEAEAEGLFKRGGSRPLINAGLAELDAGRKRLKDSALKSSEWLDHDAALQAAQARNDALERDRDQAARERSRLRRLLDAVEPAARRAAVLDELRALADVPRLAPDFTFRRRDALSRIEPNERCAAEDGRKVSELGDDLRRLDVPEPLLEQAGAIKDLHLRLGRYQKGRADLVRLNAELAGFEAEARVILRDLGREPAAGPGELAALDALRHKAPDRAAVHDLANERQAALQARDDARDALDAHDAKLQAVAARLAALGPGRDADEVRKAVKRAQKPGDLDAMLRQEREAESRDRRRADNALKSLGLWSGSLDEVEALAVPSAETIDRFQAESDEAAKALDDAQRLVDERESEARSTDDALDRLRLDGDVPTDDALSAARVARESAWDRLKLGWDAHLVPAYERSVRDADEAADRLRREANRVAEHARLLAGRARLAASLVDLRARHARALAGVDAVRLRWSALWRPLGIDEPGTPREMLAWSRRAADLAALAGSARERSESVRRLDDLRAAHRREVGDALARLGEPAADAGESLADLIDRAQEVTDAVAKESKARDRLKDSLETLKVDRPAREQAAATSRTAWGDWQSRWAAAMARIGLAADSLPAEANAVLDLTAALSDRLDKARARRAQIESITGESKQYTIDVWGLADRVAPDLAVGDNGFDPEPAAVELTDRLARAQKAQQRRDHLAAQLVERTQALESARDEIARARGELAVLRREARCDADDALPAVEERSARRQSLEKELAGLNAQLTKLSGGSPLEPFLAEAGRVDHDGLAPEVARLDERIAALEGERETVNQTIGQERALLRQMDGSARAADAGQEAEDLCARIKDEVEQYARLRLASAVLRAGIERYRKRTQEPVLERASALFSALTLGSFERLAVTYDDRDTPVLQGVRPGGREAVGVPGMSLGTADQLYLALRLATLEAYLDRREPLPLVVDDVLIQFDNDRSRATLSALAALSKRTQVLVFTHHEHLLDLAASCVPPGLLFTHRLPGAAAAAGRDLLNAAGRG